MKKKYIGYVAIMVIACVLLQIVFDILTWFGGTAELCGGITIVMLFPLFTYMVDNWYWSKGV